MNRKLTDHGIAKTTKIYTPNLKREAPDIDKMRNSVTGGIFHMAATDQNPRHKYCLDGPESWCTYKQAIAKGEQPPKDKPTYNHGIVKTIWHTIVCLVNKDLKICSCMLAQNNNESFSFYFLSRLNS